MHTFLKRKGRYEIGMWLPGHDGRTSFGAVLFTVDTLDDAIRMVNILNGGSGEPIIGLDTSFIINKDYIKLEEED
jgi:hypothetical protein